mmetsp:Transcript_3277/g.12441  ORF Transcript_3277/g.12441 Transcript_3277/m.12441 type:complete len:87 (+) Transcript_3277:79-339(+)
MPICASHFGSFANRLLFRPSAARPRTCFRVALHPSATRADILYLRLRCCCHLSWKYKAMLSAFISRKDLCQVLLVDAHGLLKQQSG